MQNKTTRDEENAVNPYMKPARTSLRSSRQAGTYKEFDATELYCPRCLRAVPVRKRLLLVLPEGDKYEYLCAFCSSTVGTKTSKGEAPIRLIV
jgi:hypothetical protein